MARAIPLLVGICAALAASCSGAFANASHAGWPPITGMLLMNKFDQQRPLDGRPGHDPFDGTDFSTRCGRGERNLRCVPGGTDVDLQAHPSRQCERAVLASWRTQGASGPVAPSCGGEPPFEAIIPPSIGHNELLGGGGSDIIHAGPAGDVIWGDYKPAGQPTTQFDRLYGGPGDDFIYASHGINYIWTGGGLDIVHAHFGRGQIHCDSPTVTVYVSHASRHRYRLFGCRRVVFN
jgi:hypothetical protein